MKYKAILYDNDGVINRAPDYFSRLYAKEMGFDARTLAPFFTGAFMQASVGRADLKELLIKHNDVWQWSGDPQALLDKWFAAENFPDEELLALVREQQAKGIKVYLATVQEKYRTKYLREVMFPGVFDGVFASCELGYLKTDPAFFTSILENIEAENSGLKPSEVVYFDDNEEGLTTARELGVDAYLYEDVEQVKRIVAL